MQSDEPLDLEQLQRVFRASEKPRQQWRVGLEAERFGLTQQNRPLPYAGPGGVERVFDWLQTRSDWHPIRETADGPLVALRRAEMSLTLEPGAQLELSGSPVSSVHDVAAEYRAHLDEV